MSCLCKKVFFVSELVGTCNNEAVELGWTAPADDVYQLRLNFLEAEIILSAKLFAGDEFVFPATGLNENYEYLGAVYNSDGTLITFTDYDGTIFDCISFRTTLKINL